MENQPLSRDPSSTDRSIQDGTDDIGASDFGFDEMNIHDDRSSYPGTTNPDADAEEIKPDH